MKEKILLLEEFDTRERKDTIRGVWLKKDTTIRGVWHKEKKWHHY